MRVFFSPKTRKLREDTVLNYKVTIINFSLDVTKNFDTMEYISHIFLNEFFLFILRYITAYPKPWKTITTRNTHDK